MGRECIWEDGAEVLILVCTRMSGPMEKLEDRLEVPVFSGVDCAVKIAEQLAEYSGNHDKNNHNY